MFLNKFASKEPNRGLELLLRDSYHDPTKLADLMKEFLVSKLFIRGFRRNDELFLSYEEGSLLAFTSQDALLRAKQDSTFYVYCDVPHILKILPGDIKLLLNTGPNYGKEFLPSELVFLKKGQVPPDLLQPLTIHEKQGFTVLPAINVSKKLIDTLFECLKERKNIEKAYIAQIQYKGEVSSNLIIGIWVSDRKQFSEDLMVISQAGQSALDSNEYIDFLELNNPNQSKIAKEMLDKINPFYDKSYIE